jgi:hypothetical protein
MAQKVPWTPEDEDILRQLYPKTPTREVAARLGRTPLAIRSRAMELGITKSTEKPSGFVNNFEPLTREETMKRDKIDLLSVNWSLLEMYRRELANTELRTRDRIRLMHAMSSHTATISSVMKGSEDQLGEEDDLKSQLIRLEYADGDKVTPRRIRYRKGTYVLVD